MADNNFGFTMVSIAKRELRQRLLTKRHSVDTHILKQASLSIAKKLFQLIVWQQATGIHCFISLPDEINTALIWQEASAEKICFAPVQMPNNTLATASWKPGEPLIKGPFGVLEPCPPPQGYQPLSSSQAQYIDIVIVPMLGFDQNRQRLGYGKGIYDRFIANLQELRETPATLIGLALEWQCEHAIPTEPHDVPMDIVITPSFSIP